MRRAESKWDTDDLADYLDEEALKMHRDDSGHHHWARSEMDGDMGPSAAAFPGPFCRIGKRAGNLVAESRAMPLQGDQKLQRASQPLRRVAFQGVEQLSLQDIGLESPDGGSMNNRDGDHP